jgi:hypothetical protein
MIIDLMKRVLTRGEVLGGNSLVFLVEWAGSVFSGFEEVTSKGNGLIGGFGVGFGFRHLGESVVSWVGDGETVALRGDFFEARENGTGPLDKKYERVAPEHFSAPSDDLFMKSMIMNYALEAKDKDGAPTGAFFMNEAATRAASGEVLASHKKLDAAAKAEYLNTYFPRTWAHFDVNKSGMLGVESMPQFMRFLASDQTLDL